MDYPTNLLSGTIEIAPLALGQRFLQGAQAGQKMPRQILQIIEPRRRLRGEAFEQIDRPGIFLYRNAEPLHIDRHVRRFRDAGDYPVEFLARRIRANGVQFQLNHVGSHWCWSRAREKIYHAVGGMHDLSRLPGK